MPDFAAVREGRLPYAEAVRDLDQAALRRLTDEIYDAMGAIVAGATDAAVGFAPHDPALTDPAERAWTLGHVVVHVTAGCEESAAVAAMLARGVPVPEGPAGRSRYETPWETILTARQVFDRLAESRRMCQAFLNAWPDEPHLDLTYTLIPRFGPLNAVGRYALGLFHADAHLEQLREIMRQAGEADRQVAAQTGR